MASLFPVSGLVRVGTFIADRIVIGSTVASSILWARILQNQLDVPRKLEPNTKNRTRTISSLSIKYVLLLLSIAFLWFKIQHRSLEWMTPHSLLESSLRACPRSAKSNLELSKLYSGLMSDEFSAYDIDFVKAMHLLRKAEDIDPDYCDVHYQVSQLLVKQSQVEGQEKFDMLEFEDRIRKSVLCPFTMVGAYDLFQRYWMRVLQSPASRSSDARARYEYHHGIIEDAIRREKEIETEKSTQSVDEL